MKIASSLLDRIIQCLLGTIAFIFAVVHFAIMCINYICLIIVSLRYDYNSEKYATMPLLKGVRRGIILKITLLRKYEAYVKGNVLLKLGEV